MAKNTTVIDRGLDAIINEMVKASRLEVAVGVLAGSVNGEGASIAEYATYNEYGTADIPSRPFMATSFDENLAKIDNDFKRAGNALSGGKLSAQGALTLIGQKHAERVKQTITGRNFLPALKPATVKAKKGSTKTLVDTGAMVNAIQISVRGRA